MAGRDVARRVLAGLVIAVLLAACNVSPSPTPAVPTPAPTPTSTPTSTPPRTPLPTSTPDPAIARQAATLYSQDFESGTALGTFDQAGKWSVAKDDAGNHVFCNELSQEWQSFKFGSDTRTDYAVEARVEFLNETVHQAVEVYSRIDSSGDGYRGTLYEGSAALTHYPPTTSLGQASIATEVNTWYTLRVEAAGSRVKFYIDDELVAEASDNQSSTGAAGVGAGPNTTACVDDLRIWQLTPDRPYAAVNPRAKYEGDCEACFVFSEGPLAPIADPATAGFTYRADDARDIVTLDENYQVPKGARITFENKIIIVKPVRRKDIRVFGTLTVINSLLLWRQADFAQTVLRIEKGGTLIIKDSYSFSGNTYWVNWEYEDGSTVKFDHFVGDPVQTLHGSVSYSAINYSTVKLTLPASTHDTRLRVSNAHEIWFEIFPPKGTHTFTLPAKRQWTDWSLSDLWPNTTIEVHDSYIYENAISLSPDTHVTVRDTPGGFGLGWAIFKESPGYVTCVLRNVGTPGTGLRVGEYYDDMTWNLPCIKSSLTLKNAALEAFWPAVYGNVRVKVFRSNVADTGCLDARGMLEIYESSISEVFAKNGGRIYIEDSKVANVIDVADAGSVVYGYGVTGPYELMTSNGGAYVPLDEPGPPW